MSNEIFETGDVVTCAFFGDEEFVLEKSDLVKYPLQIAFLDKDGVERLSSFTQDGKSFIYHTFPVLKLVRKKSKEREWIQVFRVTSKNKSFYLGKNEFRSYEDAFDWIRMINGIPSWEYQIKKFYKIKEQL